MYNKLSIGMKIIRVH